MDAEEFRAHGHRLIDWIIDYRERLDTLPVQAQVEPGDVGCFVRIEVEPIARLERVRVTATRR